MGGGKKKLGWVFGRCLPGRNGNCRLGNTKERKGLSVRSTRSHLVFKKKTSELIFFRLVGAITEGIVANGLNLRGFAAAGGVLF